MSERIDHEVEARALVDRAESDPSLNLHGVDMPMLVTAQVHATLALVEQQRIANIIALHRHEVKHDIGGGRSYLYEMGTEDLLPEIKEALGL